MISILPATENDISTIVDIGYTEVEAAHRESCTPDILEVYLSRHYNEAAIRAELLNERNTYSIIRYNNETVGFSNIIMNQIHPNISITPTAKLDRIYVSSAHHDKKFGAALLQFNIDLAKRAKQRGIWLFTWIGNERAIRFYKKAGFTIVGSHWFTVSDTHANENHQMLLEME